MNLPAGLNDQMELTFMVRTTQNQTRLESTLQCFFIPSCGENGDSPQSFFGLITPRPIAIRVVIMGENTLMTDAGNMAVQPKKYDPKTRTLYVEALPQCHAGT